jgi:CheY-like chemotaxis protein
MLTNSKTRVLCVDDDEDSRVMLTTLLRYALIEAKAVGNATQALSLIKTERFDLYLLDAWLPGVDGYELCRQMRRLDPHTPIIFFSGAAFEADKQRGFKAGADGYVIKPDVDALVGSITQLVSHAQSPTGNVIPFVRKISSFTPLSFGPVAA